MKNQWCKKIKDCEGEKILCGEKPRLIELKPSKKQWKLKKNQNEKTVKREKMKKKASNENDKTIKENNLLFLRK